MADEKQRTALHWFRKNLRLHDNPALCEAIKGSDDLLAVYILPPSIPDANISANRWNFLIECLEDLDRGLRSIGSRLLVVQGYPAQVIPKLLKNLHVSKLTFENESEPFGKQRDAVIAHLAKNAGVEVVSCTSHSLYDIDEVIKANDNKAPVLFDEFLDVISTFGVPESPVAIVTGDMLASMSHKGNLFEDCHVPSVEDLGIDQCLVTCREIWRGGETEAMRKLDSLLQEMVDNDFQAKSACEAFIHGSKNKLSPYLRFGCLSPRTFYHALLETYQTAKHDSPPLSLFNSLLWRDFYFLLGSNNPALNQMENNPLCLQIDWEDNASVVEQWKMGQTGFPFIDAIMRQLCLEGWIPNIAREIVGCFLTRGCMWISWEEGFKVFGELQLDAEWSINAGSWLSLSGSAFDQHKLPIFCPVETGKKIDPTGEYIRKYVPEVKGLPTEYVFEPWKAPESVQEAAGCLVGKDYPLPLVDHREQRRVCVQRLKDLAQSVGGSAAVEQRGHTSVHLFRKDLRLHDNPTLRACLEGSGTFYPVYVLDTAAAKHSKISANRWNFLLECLRDLDSQLARLGSRLFVVRGRDVEVLPKLFSEWGVSRLSFETDSEPFGSQRDAVIRHIAEEAGVELVSKTSHTLYEPGQILRANRGIAPMLFEDFVRVVQENMLTVPSPVKGVDRQLVGSCVTPVAADHHANYGVPELSELGVKDSRFVTSSSVWRGGEQEALRRLVLLEQELMKRDFEDVPLSAASMPSSPTHLSPYLRFGCLSARVMWQRLRDTYGKAKGKMPPMSFHEPLLLREFFFTMASANPGLHKMENNPLSVQYPWEENAEGLQRWKQGTTGFPWIDAVMRQLRVEGWIPHFARLAVGCFLTRGCLWINWEEGYKVFDELQLDAEWSLNVGNWLWLSGSTFVKEHVPWFCPVEVGKKIDPSGDYVRKYVPEVKGLPTEYVFEPWKAPESVQEAAGCVVGKDYPLPLVDHREQRRVCVQRLKDLAQSVGGSAAVEQRGHTSVHLFRKDLRLHDNPTLRACLEGSGTFYPVYVLDTAAAKHSKISANRWNFLLECLRDLDSQLARLGSRLFVVRGRDVEVLPKLFSEWGVSRLSFETDSEPFGSQRDAVIRHIAEEAGVELVSKTSHTLYEPGQILHANRGIAPMLFEDFVRVVQENMLTVPSPVKGVDRQLVGSCVTPVAADHHANYGVPELSELGVKDSRFVTSSSVWRGGEQEALRRLVLLEQELMKRDFEDVPLSAASMPSSPTHLSPYLRFGCLSARVMWQRLRDTYGKAKRKMPPMSFHEPLLLREFFFTMASANPGLHKMENNPLSVQYPWEENAEGLQRWKQGTTGFPWIDAVMRQLRVEGWIPHFARLAVGCFLTRGCLWINWEEGYKVFDELQLDAEWSLNVGNWLWLSGSTFVKEHVPWFCPVEVGKKIDPSGDYVRKYVPEVKGLPTEYVFEPWKAPESVQEAAGCVVGKDYPLPLVDHREQRRVCVQRLKDLAQSVGGSAAVEQRGHTSVHLFRKDLRLHDNPTLRACLEGSGTFYPVYVLDTAAAKHSKISANRWNFLLECLRDLDSQLARLGSRLFVVRGRDVEVLPKLFSEWGVSRLSFETDSEPFGSQRDAVIRHIAEEAGVELVSKTSHTLYEPGQILRANRGIAPMLFEDFVRVVQENMLTVPSPVKGVDRQLVGSCVTPVAADHHANYGVPELSELGVKDSRFVTSSSVWRGGEQEALRRLVLLEQELMKRDFEDVPLSAASMPSSPTHLSPYLRFGCLSARVMWQRLRDTYGKAKGKMPPMSFHEPLLLREFFFTMASANPGLHKMENNPLSVQYPWEENAEGLQRWKQGTTGFPWIDAVMRQLRVEGWIPHFARLAVGCFLTRGCLWINWEEGYKVFDELQLDAEWSLNVGNWLWLSGSTFVKEHVPWFCPVEVGKKIDPSGDYVRKYVPEVKGLPTEYVFEPWKAPESVQEAAGCVVGKDYPLPLVDHREQRRVCVQRLKDLAQSVGGSAAVEQRGHTSVHLFRKDLRLHDNPTLRACLEGSGTFYPVYVLDTAAAKHSKISANRWNFLLECLRDLDSQLARLGSRLFVVRGRDVEVLPKLFSEWGVSRLSFETDSEPFGSQRDAVIRHIAEVAGVELVSKTSHTLYEPGQILHANRGIAPMLFEDFVRVVQENMLTVPSPVKGVDRQLVGSCVTPVAADHHANYGVPELSELGVKDSRFVTSSSVWRGGEQEALRRLVLLEQELMKRDFEDVPLSAASMPSSPTHLSPYLRFGCLSARVMWQRLRDTYGKAKRKMPPMSFHEPLLLREFFFTMASANPGLHKMENNPLSVQYPWEENAEGLQRWKQGTTGFPWIDAVMRQLRVEGWIPHFARLAVGCFLTRGCLWINWEEGYKVFDELQLDAEWSLNVGNWLWLSGSTFVKEHVPWFCPVEVGKKIDPSGDYVRKYVPEVKGLPTEYVFEPWKAPESVQEAAGCVVGKDYPLPLVDHREQRRVCVQRLKDLAQSVGGSAAVEQRGHTSVHLFRKDLRLHDNPTLRACLEGSGTFYPVYVLDTAAAKHSKISANRWNFLLECLRDLDSQLARLGSRLFVVRGRDVEVLPKLFSEWGVSRLSFETDSEPFGSQRDAVIRHIAEEAGVELVSKTSHTLYEPGQILRANRGIAPMLFEDFVRVVQENMLTVPSPVKGVDRQLVGSCVTPVAADHHANYGVPELSELGVKDSRFVTSSSVWRGGEQEALRRLVLLEQELVKRDFEDVPLSAASMPSSPTHLSPYLRFGCLSARVMWQRLRDTYGKAKRKMPPMSFHEPLRLREFFFTMASANPGLHKMENNPLSVQYPWEENAEGLQRWKQGTTGFPWIDAVMRQLRVEGWIPHFARLAVGCFLTRGCLWINWEEGYKVFDELQLDAEWSLNVGNWLWLSGSTFVKEHVPWFCPVEVGKKIDPSGDYVRKYVPEVKGLPTEYVFEPWKAPESVQEAAGCLVGKDYPLPLVDHREQRRVCVQRLKDLAQSVGGSAAVEQRGHTSVHLFRKDLRLHDNPTLRACLEGSGTFYPVYVLDTAAAKHSKISANRWNFLLECLRDLDSQLARLGSRLFVVRGRDVEVLPKLFSEWGVSRLSFETDSEPFGSQRDAVIRHIAEEAGVELVSKTSHTLYEPGQILRANRGIAPMLFEDFVRVVQENMLTVPSPVKGVDRQLVGSCVTPVAADHHANYGVPELSELGVKDSRFVTSSSVWRGGEQEALRRLVLLEQELVKRDFEDVPLSAASMPSSPTHLSPYLRFGCLSARVMWQRLRDTYGKAKRKMPPMSFHEPLRLREFFFTMASANPGLHKMENNPLSVQYPWEENAEGLQRWKQGTTGFPWIDAVMRQLRVEGWIPHFARLAVGCFLTRGCLWINWEEGYKVFDELQLDAEWSLNVGNWLWLSGSTFVKEHVPWFCPVEVGKKIDPSGDYVRKYVPEVKGLPTEYVFEPWKAPESVQEAAGCVVGKDYPLPLVDHREQRRVCVQRLKDLAQSVGGSAAVEQRGHTSVHLFRKDLRLHDNPTLRACLEGSGTFYPVYVLDTAAAKHSKISANRWNFLLECLRDLDSQLARLGSRLFVVRGRDVEVLPKLFSEWGVSRLSFETDSEPFGSQRDAVIRHIAEEAGVELVSKTSHTLYEPGQILRANRGIAPMLFEDFVRVVQENMLTVPSPVKGVDRQLVGSCVTPVAADHHANYGVPELSELGVKDSRFVTSSSVWRGGEQEALRRLVLLEQELVKRDFEDVPLSAASMPSSPTHLSPYLRFGCLSARVMWQRLRDTYGKAKRKMPPMSFHEPLRLREFFFTMASANPGLHKMENNPLSVQYPWEENAEGLQRWKQGTTGFPWIDAVMRQLRVEGWIPHFARLAVGCFLTRGCLWINWEEGYKVFDELQLDAEWSLNVGNWLWLSGSTFVKEHVPWFCPVEVGKKIDPSGDYVRKYVPEVKGLPTEYVFEPWKAPESVQEAAGCLVGKDYPLPLVDHREQRRVCVQRLKDLAQSVGGSAAVEQRGHTSVHLFRKDLRLHDNPTLRACLEGSGTFYPVYVLDTAAAKHSKISANRWNFLLECLRDLDSQLARLGSRLFVVRGRDVEVLPKLFSEWGVSRLSFETDSEPFGSQRDAVIRHIAEEAGVELVSKTSHTLYEPGQILRANRGIAPMLFEDFVRVVQENMLTVPSPVKGVDRQLVGSCVTPVAADHHANYGVPELSELGVKDSRFVTSSSVWRGGEQEALRRLVLLEQELVKRDFEDVPLSAASMPSSPTHLSPYLRFGCLSARVMWQRLRDTYGKAKRKMPPMSFHEPLLLREFFFTMASANPGLHKMENNPLSVQYPWEENAEGLQRWKQGTTGFPWIDAVMRQLRVEGWIPHFARLAVGCFLTRGCLWINWEEGYKVFDELQLDAEWSLNVGNWLWLSGGTFVKEHVPWFCPVEVGKKIDPSGDYVRKYVPEVKGLPTEYVFEPWKAPESVQEAAVCVVGKDYPLPLVDHIEQRRVCVQRLKDLAQSVGGSAAVEQRGHTSVHLFRKDLRLHDNPTLRACLEGSGTFYPVYVLDTAAAKHSKISANRWNFLLECLRDLDSQLARLGSRLFVVRGRDVEVLPKLFSEWGVSRLSFETDSEPFGSQRDAVIRHIAEKAGVELVSKTSHTLYEPGQILRANRGIAPMLFEDFVRVVQENMLTVPSPVKGVDRQLVGSCVTPVAADHHANYGVPELSELGVKDTRFVTSSSVWRGGEQEALRRLVLLEQELVKRDFEDVPLSAASMPSSPTHLSPYLRFGCLSARVMWQRLRDTYGKAKGKMPPMSFHEPLLLREFFFTMASANPGLHKMENNPLSVQYPWEENAEGLQRWKQGTTGFPWIDAVMRQLRVEGWIPHFARLAVGCFLTRGCLWINWEEGYKVFDELQLDAEWSLNVGNWLWLSGSTFVKEHVPWFCPVEVGKKIDPSGEYVRKYVPEVKRLPVTYLFEPWKAPFAVQKAARCIVGDDYPAPVVDHIEQRNICVQRLKDLCISLDISGHKSLHWFRKDLRLHDNPSLRACVANSRVFYGVYVLEYSAEERSSVSPNRWEFLLQSLRDLDKSLSQFGSRLYVVKGRPVETFPHLFKQWDITRLSFEADCEPYCKIRDNVVSGLAREAGIEVISCVSHTLYDSEALFRSTGGKTPLLIDEFKELVLQHGRPEMPVKRVDRKLFGSCVTPVGRDHNQLYGVPTLEELGFHKTHATCFELYPGGEDEALVRLEAALHEMKNNNFCEPAITASSLMPSASHLSPYLRLGCLSPRLLYQRMTEEYIKTKTSNPPLDLYSKLLMREFFFAVGSQVPDAQEMINNPLSLQIPWEDSAEYLERWKQGMTGFPWIDAIMRQLRTEGWIHDLGRRAVGSFLTRGCLWINWEEGFKVFDELQLDAERSLNSGNWLWLSGSSFVKDHVPWLCPVEVGKKIDPTGEYVRKYVPEVRNLPTEYIFEPWLAPRVLQKSCGCVIGEDYPGPLVDHVQQRIVCVQRLRDLAFALTTN